MAKTKKTGLPPRRRHRRGRPQPHPSTGAHLAVPLYKRSLSHFDPIDRDRGRGFFQEGRVRLDVDGARARARVEDAKQSYGVGLDWSRVAARRALHVFCECRRFADGKTCEHVWAALLALHETGSASRPPGKDRVGLRKDRPSRWRNLGVVETREVQAPRAASQDRGGMRAQQPGHGRRPPEPKGDHRSAGAPWRRQLDALRDRIDTFPDNGREPAGADRRLCLLINTAASAGDSGLILDVFEALPTASGNGEELSELRRASADPEDLERLFRPAERADGTGEPMAVVTALPVEPPMRKGRQGQRRRVQSTDLARVRRLRLSPHLYEPMLRHLSARDALGWWDGRARDDLHPLSWDDGDPWRLVLRLEAANGPARLSGALEREGESLPLNALRLILPSGAAAASEAMASETMASETALVVLDETIARLEPERERDFAWIELLRDTGEMVIPRADLEEAITELFEIPGLPRIEGSHELDLSEERTPLRPRLLLESATSVLPNAPLQAKLSFTYGSLQASAEDPRSSIVDWPSRKFLRRDMGGEHRALVRLLETGVRPVAYGQGHELELAPHDLADVAEPLLAEGWEVEVWGVSVRSPSPPSLRVESGIDWFELSGSTDFAGDPVKLKTILEAVSRGDRFVKLSDGSQGLVPSSWMEMYGSLAQLAHDATDEGLRFRPSQALLFDALLTAMPPLNVDRAFAQLREKLQSFDRVKPKKEPRGFGGTLREYQRDGLGWLMFLREFGLGGVLADDMGLGKTVQVLALLRTHRTPSKSTGLPSLVVAPRSLVYNWIEEATRFTPSLKVVEYLGPDRKEVQEQIADYDVLVTSYGTLRRDVDVLRKVEFDTVILDEAQAIKNRDSQSAKASRLLRARHRLALTGTPIENHLGELGSIFEFLNPGLLGSLPRLDALNGGRTLSKRELQVVAEGIRPFILRRTKAQVLKDLPPKTEQVLYCTLNPSQRELYDQLRQGYQAALLGEVESKGVGGAAFQVLEALLRLRQVACHPGLVNKEWNEAGSAKLETLFEQVSEVLEEGHKLLVFSQFTKLLAYVRGELDARGVPYAYLDGKTRDRGEVVERFQTDPGCNVFLISLKAGGLGLNLTAAGYVFLLDPWWNPAVEAQAIDRAHRIGQTQPVFSYRLIARDTVEEKILELQLSKRQLADAILDEGSGLPLRDLTAEDLKLLLS